MNKLFLTIGLTLTLFLTGCGLIPMEKKTYLSEGNINIVNTLEEKQQIIEHVGKPAKTITEPKILEKKLTAYKSILIEQRKEATKSLDNVKIDDLNTVITKSEDLLSKISDQEKVECLVYYWKTKAGEKMEKDIYIYDNLIQFSINQ